MRIGSGSSFSNALAKVIVTLPMLKGWLPVGFDLDTNASFKRLFYILRPVFRLPWSTLTIDLDNVNGVYQDIFPKKSVLHFLICTSIATSRWCDRTARMSTNGSVRFQFRHT
jgi:hypothetical protein